MASLVNPKFTGLNSNRANAAFMLALFTILSAWAFQYIGGFEPCELCLGQRIPYYVGLPILAAIIISWRLVYVPLRIAATILVAGLFIWSTYLGAFHAGVEWGYWAGPTECTGLQDISFGDLGNIDATRVVPCDQPEIRFFGLSFAGLNAIVSLLISALLVWSIVGQIKRFMRMQRIARHTHDRRAAK